MEKRENLKKIKKISATISTTIIHHHLQQESATISKTSTISTTTISTISTIAYYFNIPTSSHKKNFSSIIKFKWIRFNISKPNPLGIKQTH